MKRFFILVILLGFNINFINASHEIGGELSWDCLSTGKYVFNMTVYRDCSGIPSNYQNQNLEIFGNTNPTNSSGSPITSILLKPDSNRWLAYNQGDINLDCNPNVLPGPYSCANGDRGAYRALFYKSDPIELNGVPPSSGWTFIWTAPCCRPNINNTTITGSMLLKAQMFQDNLARNANPCFDSSPQFLSRPHIAACRQVKLDYNILGVDRDLDSLVFKFERLFNAPASNPVVVPYINRFSFSNPTPDSTFDPRNIGATLNSYTGMLSLANFSDVGFPPTRYYLAFKISSYRKGQLIANVFQEYPIAFNDCNLLQSGNSNNAPQVTIDGLNRMEYQVDIVAGQNLRVPIAATDNDPSGAGSGIQNITIVPEGFMFARDKIDKNNCEVAGIAPCAVLENRSPTLNGSRTPPRYELNGLAALGTQLIWEPKCWHVAGSDTRPAGQSASTYNFVFQTQDDHCPIPGINYPTISVRVRDPLPLTEPIMKGASIGLDGRLTYAWVPPIDSASTFNKYNSEHSAPLQAQSPRLWQPLDIVSNYQLSMRNGGYQFFANGSNNQPNILAKRPNRDWYFRMYAESGCTGDVQSAKSEPVQVMQVNAVPIANANRSRTSLNWNRPKPLNANTYPYFQYESPTHFYIWQNSQIEQNGFYLGGEAVDSNWVLIGNTLNTRFEAQSATCDGRIGYRIEARDTVITWKGGTAPRQDSLDTLVFSTFSMIDTVLMRAPKAIITDTPWDFLSANQGVNLQYQWIKCATNAPIAGATQRQFIPQDTGSYKVVVDISNCPDTSDCIVIDNNLDTVVVPKGNLSLVSKATKVRYQWFDCSIGLSIAGATDSIFTPADTGYYAVALSAYEMRDTSGCFPFFPIGLEENKFKRSTIIQPNPTQGNLWIQFKASVSGGLILRNVKGQQVQAQEFENRSHLELSIKGAAGVYILEIRNSEGQTAQWKVVKQ